MKLGKNLVAGVVNSAWSALIGLAVIPIYLRYLGIEAYGLIGFFVTTQMLLSLLDLGLAPTINREVARGTASGNLDDARSLLYTLSKIYSITAFFIGLIVFALAPLIARYWFQDHNLDPETLTHAIMLMGLVVACRWPIGLYFGVLLGLQKIVLSSSINIVLVTMASLGAVLVLKFISPTIEAFFIWQSIIAIIHFLALRTFAWRALGHLKNKKFDLNQLKQIWKFTAGMSGVAITGVILIQVDKIILSKTLSLESFGYYSLAGVLASGLYVLLTPLFNAIYPKMSALVALEKTEDLTSLYRSGTQMFLSILFPIAITAAVLSKELIFIWTGNEKIATSTAPIVSILLAGTAFNGVMHFPYALQLAYGESRLPLIINGLLLTVMIPMVVTLSNLWGALGGAASWAILNAVYIFIGTWLTHKYLLKGIASTWLLKDVGLPLAVALLINAAGGELIRDSLSSPYAKIMLLSTLIPVTFTILNYKTICSWLIKIKLKTQTKQT